MEDEGEPILESTWDAELGAILQQYLAECGKEGQLTREQFLSKHPELAERLAACRDTIDFLLPVGANQEQKSSLPQVIGEYEILGELGRGGMGVVYEARQPSLDRIVALKVMRLGIVDPSALDRFQREAETAGGLHHTNIVPVYATGKEEDISWYAMQRIEGDSLCAKITEHYESEPQRSVPESQVAAIGIQAADALAHAHDREVIHRDIKPANLIIESSGRVWLTDFGLARRLVDVSATLSGTIIGTPRYMSPEQANLTDGEVDSRSDIYSLGATLYELATGQVPIAGDDPFQVIARIRNEDPPQPSQYREDLSKDLEAVIMKAMAKLPEDRYQNARELAEDLRAVQEHRSVQARGLSRWERFARWRRRNQAKVQQISSAAAVTAAVILSGILAWSMFWESRQGAFRLRGGGGPLTANIFKVAEGGSREYETSLTVPMQSPVNLDDADYDIQLSPLGDWSRIIRMPVIRGAFRDYRLQRSRSMRRGIPSDEGPVIPVSGFEGDAVLVKKGALLSRQSLDEKADWILDVSAIRVEQTELPAVDSDPIDKSGNEEKSGPTDRLVNFGDSAPYPLGNSLYSNTTQANAAFALRSPIDLDGDGQSDTIVAADQEPALLAINAEGEILWARECVFDPASNSSLPNWDSRWSPAVLSIINIGDINQDSIQDLIVNLVRVQPKVQTDSALVWISGKDGSVIRSLRMPKIGPAHPKWPYDGILPAQASPDRKWSVISFETDGVEQNVRAPHNTVQSERRYAVPSPLRLLQDAKTVFYQAGSACQLLDSSSGELRASFQTNLQPAMSPREIRTNSGESLLLYAGIPTGQSATQFALIALDQGGTRLWTYTSCLDMVEDTHFMLRRTAWPLVADLNGDGSDEILALPETRSDRYSHDLMLLGAADGKPMWAEPCSIFGITGLATARIVSMQDINDDGWRDLALASIGGPPTLGPSASRWFDYSSSVSRFGEVFIYIDWISGKDGQKLSWSRQRLPWLTESMWVCEIDAMRTINESKKTGTVEVAILFGGEAQTQELSGLTLRFQPNQMQAIAVANGLTPCGPPNQGSRVYRQHAGPFQDLDDKIVLATEENNSTEYLGTSEPLIAWRNADGVDFLGARANGFLNVLDPTQGKTAWYVDIPIDRYHFLQPIQWRNGSVDFFLQTTPGQAPFLLDGETGKTLWANRIRVQENVFHCQAITDPAGERLLIADDTDRHNVSAPWDGLRLNYVAAGTGQAFWTRQLFREVTLKWNASAQFEAFQSIDLNADKVLDLVGLDVVKDQFQLIALNGATGEDVWRFPLYISAHGDDVPPPFQVVTTELGPRILCLRRLPDRPDLEAVWLDGVAGRKLDSKDLLGFSGLVIDGRTHSPPTLQVLSTNANEVHEIAFACTENQFQAKFGRLSVSGDTFSELQNFDPAPKDQMRSSGRFGQAYCWLEDVCGDEKPERLFFTKEILRCFAWYEDHELWNLQLERSKWKREIRFDTRLRKLVMRDLASDPRISLIDTEAGKILKSLGPEHDKLGEELPLVISQGSLDKELLATSTVGGLRISTLSNENSNLGIPFHGKQDPRMIRKYPLRALRSGKGLLDLLFESLCYAGALCLMALAPLGYLWHMIKNRNWSLQFLLLGPVVVLLCLSVWRSQWLSNQFMEDLILVGLIVVMGSFGMTYAIRKPRSYGFTLCIGSLVVAAIFFGNALTSTSKPAEIQYTLSFRDLLVLTTMFVFIGACVVFVLRNLIELYCWFFKPTRNVN